MISKCDQIGTFLPIWSHLLKKSLMEIFISCAVSELYFSKFVGESRMALVSREIVSSVFKVLFQNNYDPSLYSLFWSINYN